MFVQISKIRRIVQCANVDKLASRSVTAPRLVEHSSKKQISKMAIYSFEINKLIAQLSLK
jgi:hypothetical protein